VCDACLHHHTNQEATVARKSIYISDLSGQPIEEGKGATITMKFIDAGSILTP
jgi:hypothetical protein